ncbi:D-tagatose-bisphosphate aldolase, class II, non-catalytic subunit [uncultured Sphingomonas sp.]|uniref:D-tagatose-bisphosphate aldolase, class II, non-catalytic subunit n=1 Tax=uncultured Sphingomonas sp. TaxID=158754 RepID=UPI0025D85947|nr:D-tagatose-bisphosphate aldolase, class II, non-catalytic subunit [uncultured Sphingomonas sp.]
MIIGDDIISISDARAHDIRSIIQANIAGKSCGIYSVCCTHPLILEAAVDQAIADGGLLLVEATANQVNQFGGYTGMTPADFRLFVESIASQRGLPLTRLALGGDHLGPVAWTAEPAAIALAKACDLVAAFAEAGFVKIHLDCSMPLQGDPDVLDDSIIAARAAELCARAELAAIAKFGSSSISYVIGTEVPPPGGASEQLAEVPATDVEAAHCTLVTHRQAFEAAGLNDAWRRVIGLVVQPGVEFDNASVIDYPAGNAAKLRDLAEGWREAIAFEAHSTDYQLPQALAALVENHFAILKVGPALTFALREALFALSHIEDELVESAQRSDLRAVCERRMRDVPGAWNKFYHGDETELRLLRRYSFSDRIRYYWPDPALDLAVERLIANIDAHAIPAGLLSQYLPVEFEAVRQGTLMPDARSLIRHKIRTALLPYAAACSPAVTIREDFQS